MSEVPLYSQTFLVPALPSLITVLKHSVICSVNSLGPRDVTGGARFRV